MIKKTVTRGEFTIDISDNGHVDVTRVFDNSKATMRMIAKNISFPIDEEWTTRQLGAKLINEFGEGNNAKFDNIIVNRLTDGKIVVSEVFTNTKDILRKISDEMGFYYENTWNTQTLGSKLVDYLTKYKDLIDKCFNTNNEDQIYDIANIIALQIEGKYGFRWDKSHSLVRFSSWFEAVKNKKKIENLNLKEIAESVFCQIDNHEIM